MGLLKTLRIGVRIAAGYAIVLLLLVVLFAVGSFTLTTLEQQLNDMNAANTLAMNTSEAQVALSRLRLNTQIFAVNGGEATLTAIKTDTEQLQKALERIARTKGVEGNARDIMIFNDFLDKFRTELAPLVGGRHKREQILRDEFKVLGPEARRKLLELFETAVARPDLSGAAAVARIEDQWMGARLSLNRFMTELSDKESDQARQRLTETDRGLKAFVALQTDVKVKLVANEVLAIINRYSDKASELVQTVQQNQRIVTDVLPAIGIRFDNSLEEYQNRMERQALDSEAIARHGIGLAQHANLIIGITTVAIGLLLAMLVGRSVLRTLGQALDTLNNASRQVATGSNQASIAIGQVSDGARTQMNAVKQIGIAIKQSANAIEDVAGSSSQTYKFTKDAVVIVDNAVHNVANLDRLVKTISENSRNISRITSVITRIANQTNMLSLNAAIEAARAGEHGRGFAVVAEEVRKLAEEVANSAQEIAEIVATANSEAERGVAVSREVGTDMAKIGEVFRQIERMASVIASATTQQQASTKEIDATVQSLAQISEGNATASDEILATMKDLVKIADGARTGAENFKAMM
ncbi:MAG: methyl-accepting chemotaxis protein [Rhodospirillaceae bacterium]